MRERPLFTLIASLPVACGSMALVCLLPSRHRLEVASNLAAGCLLGLAGWLIAVFAISLTSFRKLRLPPGISRWLSFPYQFVLISVVAAAIVGVACRYFDKPFWGMLTLVGWSLPLPILLAAHRRVFGFSPRLLGAIVVFVALALGICWLVVPLSSRPTEILYHPRRPEDLVVLSWNLGIPPPDGRASQTKHLEGIAKVIRETGAEVVCLQEVRGPAYLRRLADLLGEGWEGILTEDGDKLCAILSRRPGKLYRLERDLPFGGPAGIRLKLGGREIEILSVHLPAEKGQARRRSYAQWLVRHAEKSAIPVVLAGDFNMDPESFWDRTSNLFTENAAIDRQILATLCRIWHDVGANGAGTGILSRRIDLVLIPEDVMCVEYSVLFNQRQGWMDHGPVLARLRMK